MGGNYDQPVNIRSDAVLDIVFDFYSLLLSVHGLGHTEHYCTIG